MSPTVLEQLLRDVFSDFFDCEVNWTGRGADGGVDLFHVQSSHGNTLYQVKRRTGTHRKESVKVVRQLLGVLVVRGASTGIVVTTAPDFTAPAKEEAESPMLLKRGIRLELVSYEKLLDVIRSTNPKNRTPWRKLITRDAERLARHKAMDKKDAKADLAKEAHRGGAPESEEAVRRALGLRPLP